jgi:hypothetical protein
MKRRSLALVILSLMFIVTIPAEGYAEGEAGRVLAVKKDVYRIRADSRENAKPRMPLLMQDAVETDEKSRTKLFFTDDSILNLGERSMVEVEEYLYNAEKDRTKAVYKLVEGYLKAVVGKSDLEIHTPTSIVASRGTVFIVSIEGEGDDIVTRLIVLEGKVETLNITPSVKGSVTVSAGEMTMVPSQKAPEPVQPIDMNVLQQFTDKTVVISDVSVNKTALPALVEPSTDYAPPPPLATLTPPVMQQPPPQAPVTPVTININFP